MNRLTLTFFQNNVIKIKKHFNEMFTKMAKIKENEMDLIVQRKNRISKIQDDINLLEQLNGKQTTEFMRMVNFTYSDDEIPHTILSVVEHFDGSSSLAGEKSLLKEQKSVARTEFKQSFYNQALIDMMNGVLEVCWEDELKKDIPKPFWMQRKTEFNEQEKQEIRKYQGKVEKLMADRETYIKQLLLEKMNLENLADRQVQQLHKCLNNFLRAKIHVQFVICAEELKILMISMDRLRYLNVCAKEKQLTYVKEDYFFNKSIQHSSECSRCRSEKDDLKLEINDMLKMQQMLDQNMGATKLQYDELTAKDQQLDRHFKTFFMELVSTAIIDQAYRIFK